VTDEQPATDRDAAKPAGRGDRLDRSEREGDRGPGAIRPMLERYPLAEVNEAYERVASGRAQFRVVSTMD
jgi:hypothetical protein